MTTTQPKNKSSLAAWRGVKPYLGPARARLTVLGLVSAVSGFLEAVVLVLLVQLALAIATGQGLAVTGLGPLARRSLSMGTLFAVILGGATALLALRWVAARLSARMAADTFTGVRAKLFQSFTEASWELQSREREGNLQELMTMHASRASMAVLGIATALASIINFGALMASAFLVHPVLAAVIAAAVGILFLCVRPIRGLGQQFAHRQASANLEYVRAVAQGTRMAEEVRTFDVGSAFEGRLGELNQSVALPYFQGTFVRTLVPALYRSAAIYLILGGLGAVYAFGGSGAASLGGVVLIMLRALGYSQSTQVYVQQIAEGIPYIDQLREQERRYASHSQSRVGRPLDRIDRVSFDRVSFAYHSDEWVLKDVSFEVSRGEAVGIVGPSGAGKTTLIEILLRLRDPRAGRFLVNGEPASTFALGDWYQRVALVPQDSRVFSATVADNIRFFRPGIGEEQIERAARLARIHDDIVALPEGYQTILGEREGAISGGQRQRLSLARALAGDPGILVLDEPTSSLDLQTEALIQESLESLRGQITLFIVAHRLSTLGLCDRIMVFDDRTLQAFDEPAVLLQSNGFYREAVSLSRL